MFLAEILTIFLISLLSVYYLYYRYCFTYWKRKGVPTVPPIFPAGNITLSLLGKESLFIRVQNLYKEFKAKGHKHAGLYFFNGPIYFPISLDIVKSVLITDFEYFTDRGTFIDEKEYPLSVNLFNLTGNRWKSLRAKLTPTFSTGKIKGMYEILLKISENLVKTMKPTQDDNVKNIKHIFMNFAADIIGSCAFGMDFNTLDNPTCEFSKMVWSVFNSSDLELAKVVLKYGLQNPGMVSKVLHRKYVDDYFMEIFKKTLEYRQTHKIVRNDFLNILLEVKDTAGLTDNEILAQAFLIFIAGFETVSSTMSYCLHELSHNQEIQNKLRKEIYDILGKDSAKYTYEDLMELSYLDKVLKETLRKYPAGGQFNRVCAKDYKVPGTDLIIEKNTPVIISLLALQRDPEYYPDPMKFDPERFSDQREQPIYMPFGGGPRFCLGKRFGQLQTKLGVACLIAKYKFFPTDKTPREIEFDKFTKNVTLHTNKGVFCKVVEA